MTAAVGQRGTGLEVRGSLEHGELHVVLCVLVAEHNTGLGRSEVSEASSRGPVGPAGVTASW